MSWIIQVGYMSHNPQDPKWITKFIKEQKGRGRHVLLTDNKEEAMQATREELSNLLHKLKLKSTMHKRYVLSKYDNPLIGRSDDYETSVNEIVLTP